MKRNIILTYRGTDESNKVASATKTYVERKNHFIDNYFNLTMINLDKRKIEKFVEKLEDTKDTILYVYYDEENLLSILEQMNYKNLEVRQYKEEKNRWNNSKGMYNKLGEQIIQEYKDSLGTLEFWINYKNEAIKITINEYDYQKTSMKYKFFKTEKECVESILTDLKYTNERSLNMIDFYKKEIEKYKEKIKEDKKSITKLLEKINKDNYKDNKKAVNINDLDISIMEI